MKPGSTGDTGGAPGGVGGTTGADPKAGGRRGSGEGRSFEPGPDSPGGDAANSNRPATSDENSDMSNGSGAD